MQIVIGNVLSARGRPAARPPYRELVVPFGAEPTWSATASIIAAKLLSSREFGTDVSGAS